ncbi:MAG TPA: hypothetical protein PLS53_11825 [Thermoanaerobaculaceae bacterium]|nr:hypothetical protein [Thermoanaerobaculaceae bacterium]
MSRARFGLYQPFIEDRNVRRLYQLKSRLNETHNQRLPMTVVLNRILDNFFETYTEIRDEAPSWVVTVAEPGR